MTRRIVRRRDLIRIVIAAPAAALLASACAAPAAPTNTPAPAAPAQAPAAPPPTQAPAAPAPTNTTAPVPAAPTNTPAAAAAAKPQPTPTPNPLASVPVKPGMKVVEWWWPWSGGLTGLQTLANLATDFNNTHDKFQVKALPVDGAWGGGKLLTTIAAGNPPAVQTGGVGGDLWLAGGAMPLNDYIKNSKVINLEDVFESNLAGGQFKGKQYGFPQIECFLRGQLCVNKALFDQKDRSSAKIAETPTDLDTLYQWAKDMTVMESSGAIKTLGFHPLDAEAEYFGGYWMSAYGHKFYDQEANKYILDHDTMVEMFTTIQKFADIAGAEKLTGFVKAYGTWTQSPTAMMPSGVEAMNVNGYWAPGELTKSAPGKSFAFGWQPVPASRKGAKIAQTGGHNSALPKGTPAADEGFQIIEYLNTPKAMDIIFDTTGWLGSSKSYIAKANVSKYPGLDFYVRAAKEATVVWGDIFNPIGGFVGDQWNIAVEAVNYHKLTPKEAAKQMQTAADKELKNRFPNGV
jgi:ABC-type glycerol-3-phosphate transport system substrate-binding protein